MTLLSPYRPVTKVLLTLALAALLPLLPLLAVPAAAQDLGEIVVRILPQPTVPGETYTLGEVAEFDGFDVPAIAELAQVALGRSPVPGRTAFLNEQFIRSRLTGMPVAERVRIEVPKNAQVARTGQLIRGTDVEQLVKAQALKDSQAPADDVKLEVLSTVQDVQLPTGAVDWEIAQMGKNLSPSGDRSYQVAAKLEGKEAWRTIVRVRQKVYQMVVQASKPLRRDQVIGKDDVTEVRRVMPAGRDAGFIGSAKLAIGMRTKRPVGQDEPIHDGMLQAQTAVNEGGRVTIVFQSNLLRMEVPGVAMVSGQIGQFIPVRNLDTNRIVYGIVQPDESVKVN